METDRGKDAGSKQSGAEAGNGNREGRPPEKYHYHYDRSVHINGACGNVNTGDGFSGKMQATLGTVSQNWEKRQKEDWTRGMVETSAFKKIMEKLKKGITWITIKGSPGEGKTTVAKMALREVQRSGRQVFQVRSPEDFTKVTKICSRPVILLDDVLGDLEFDHVAWLRWKDVFHKVLDPIVHRSHEPKDQTSTGKQVTVLLVGRDYVLNGATSYMGRLHDVIIKDVHVVDMSHSVLRPHDEKQRIWDAPVGPSGIVLPQQTVRNIFSLDGGHGFPHVCKLFVTIHRENPNISAEKFFRTPIEVLNDTIKMLLNDDNKLALFQEIIKRQGRVTERDLEMVDRDRKLKVKQKARELLGTYLRMEDGYFVLDHPSVYDSVAFNLCTDHTLFVIENCSLSFLHERLRLEVSHDTAQGPVNSETDMVVYISQSYAGDLAKRFADEISKRNLVLVLSHQACTQANFINMMMSQVTQPIFKLVKLTDSGYESEHFLSLLASNKSARILKYIDNHPQIHLTQSDIDAVLSGVCEYAASDVLAYLLQHHAKLVNINIIFGSSRQTPLMLSAKSQDTYFVRQILSLSPDVNARDYKDATALHYFCEYGLISAVQLVIDMGADIDVMDLSGHSPLFCASKGNQTVVVKLLLDRGARIEFVRQEN